MSCSTGSSRFFLWCLSETRRTWWTLRSFYIWWFLCGRILTRWRGWLAFFFYFFCLLYYVRFWWFLFSLAMAAGSFFYYTWLWSSIFVYAFLVKFWTLNSLVRTSSASSWHGGSVRLSFYNPPNELKFKHQFSVDFSEESSRERQSSCSADDTFNKCC